MHGCARRQQWRVSRVAGPAGPPARLGNRPTPVNGCPQRIRLRTLSETFQPTAPGWSSSRHRIGWLLVSELSREFRLPTPIASDGAGVALTGGRLLRRLTLWV